MAQTQVKKINYTRPWLYPKQEEAFFGDDRIAVVEASTKAGKTVACIAWLVEQALLTGKPNRHYWWVAPFFPTASIAYRRVWNGLTPGSYSKNDSKMTITLPNGSIIEFKGADNTEGLYGEDVYAAVIDEFTRCKQAAWTAVRTTLTATQGPIRLIGNVRGRANWGYAIARRAESGEPNMHYEKITAFDAVEAGVFPMEELESAKRDLPDHAFRELYLAEPADDGGNPFGLDAIQMQIGPLSQNRTKAIGIDLAKSHDYTVVIGIDAAGDVCLFERWQSSWQETIRRVLALVDNTPALVDSTGVGDAILEQLQAERPSIFTGFKFSSSSKQQLMEELAVNIQQRKIRYPEGQIVNELETFEYAYHRTHTTYEASEGAYDDCVCALALALHHWGPNRIDALPYGWLRSDPDFRTSVLGEKGAA